jgi:hypothetical protein
MSKGNMLLGHARGKVGSLVFSRVNGQQITRARAEQVKNPQTDAQVIQRILLNTVAQAYSRMAGICDHSFEGVKAGQDSMSYFMRTNLNALRAKIAEQGSIDTEEVFATPIGQSFLASNDYIISKGSLPVVNASGVANNGMDWNIGTGSYKAVIDRYGLQRGDQVTFCLVRMDDQNVVTFKYARIILDPRNEDGAEASITTALFSEGKVNKPNPKNEVADFTFSNIGDTWLISAGYNTIAGCIIASRQKEDGTWLRSNSNMVTNSIVPVGMTVAAALNEFRSGGIDIVNPKYLNNASRGAGAAAGGNITTFDIAVTVNDPDGGSATGGGTVNRGQSVTLTATHSSSGTFVGWYEGETRLSTANPYTFKPTRSMNIVAHFNVSSGD